VCSSIFEVVTAFDSPSINASMTSCMSLHLNSGPVPDFEFPAKLERLRAGFLSLCPPHLGHCVPHPDEAAHAGKERASLSTWFLVWLYQETGTRSLLFQSRLSQTRTVPAPKVRKAGIFLSAKRYDDVNEY